MDLADIIGAEGVHEIQQLGEIRFHALGDSGHGNAHDAERVADDMAGATSPEPTGSSRAAAPPWRRYLWRTSSITMASASTRRIGTILARSLPFPETMTGSPVTAGRTPGAFLDNFCANTVAVAPQASASGIYRQTMTQPGILVAGGAFRPCRRLYSNRIENPGISAPRLARWIQANSIGWLKACMIRGMADKKALMWRRTTRRTARAAQRKPANG
jgi:hypothetical protein